MHPWHPWGMPAVKVPGGAHVQLPCSPQGTVSLEPRQAAGVRAMHPILNFQVLLRKKLRQAGLGAGLPWTVPRPRQEPLLACRCAPTSFGTFCSGRRCFAGGRGGDSPSSGEVARGVGKVPCEFGPHQPKRSGGHPWGECHFDVIWHICSGPRRFQGKVGIHFPSSGHTSPHPCPPPHRVSGRSEQLFFSRAFRPGAWQRPPPGLWHRSWGGPISRTPRGRHPGSSVPRWGTCPRHPPERADPRLDFGFSRGDGPQGPGSLPRRNGTSSMETAHPPWRCDDG